MSQRKSSSSSSSAVPEESDSFLPLDDDQQSELVDKIKEQAVSQAKRFRKMFSAAFALMTLLFVLCFVRMFLAQEHGLPFEDGLKHVLPVNSWLIFYGVSAVIFGICSGSMYDVREIAMLSRIFCAKL